MMESWDESACLFFFFMNFFFVALSQNQLRYKSALFVLGPN